MNDNCAGMTTKEIDTITNKLERTENRLMGIAHTIGELKAKLDGPQPQGAVEAGGIKGQRGMLDLVENILMGTESLDKELYELVNRL